MKIYSEHRAKIIFQNLRSLGVDVDGLLLEAFKAGTRSGTEHTSSSRLGWYIPEDFIEFLASLENREE